VVTTRLSSGVRNNATDVIANVQRVAVRWLIAPPCG
jgi:hypothetical protein